MRSSVFFALFTGVFVLLCLALPPSAGALTADQLLIVTNKRVPESDQLAAYYMKKRSVPAANVIRLATSNKEDVSRQDYEKEIAGPVRNFLSRNDPEGKRFACLVVMYGMPLRVGHPVPTDEENVQIDGLQRRRAELAAQIALTKDQGEAKTLREQQAKVQNQLVGMDKLTGSAAVDSELALVMENRFSSHWLPNKYFLGFRGMNIADMPQRALLVSRLDGPTDEVVRRIIDDSVEVEKTGLSGKAYFDARWPLTDVKNPSYYQVYDRLIHEAARVVEKSEKMPVVLDERERLFQPGEAPNAALYCGWYSLGKYVDAFTWARGAVGFHAASSECTTLKNKESTVWCKCMLEKGVAATLGPVAEPYLESFPRPDVFFGSLLDGRFTLAECYALSIPFWAWRQVLIGDPLYRPFAHRATKK